MEAPEPHQSELHPHFCRHKIEEETIPEQVIMERYQVISKSRFGSTSTAWLARDLSARHYVALKFFIQSSCMSRQLDDERQHHCLVHPPLFESVLTFLRRNPVGRLPSAVLAFVTYRVFMALDFLHNECHVIHTDPIPREEVAEGRLICISREMPRPKRVGHPVLCDFGSAMFGDNYREDIDIWNVGCMIWDMYEGGELFRGYDPEFERYRSRKHLAEMINLLGPPPPEFIAQGRRKDEFFSSGGRLLFECLLTDQVPLEERETTLKGEDREAFLRLTRKMLQWDPSKRSTVKELVED
ncbi:kinase-like domain-containing protein [Aspergillus filifer]